MFYFSHNSALSVNGLLYFGTTHLLDRSDQYFTIIFERADCKTWGHNMDSITRAGNYESWNGAELYERRDTSRKSLFVPRNRGDRFPHIK